MNAFEVWHKSCETSYKAYRQRAPEQTLFVDQKEISLVIVFMISEKAEFMCGHERKSDNEKSSESGRDITPHTMPVDYVVFYVSVLSGRWSISRYTQEVEIILAAEPIPRKSRRNPIVECVDRSFPPAILMISSSSIRARANRARISVSPLWEEKWRI